MSAELEKPTIIISKKQVQLAGVPWISTLADAQSKDMTFVGLWDSKTTLTQSDGIYFAATERISGNGCMETVPGVENLLVVKPQNSLTLDGFLKTEKLKELDDFLNLTVNNSSLEGVQLKKHNMVTVSRKKGDDGITFTYKFSGTAKINNSTVGEIDNYQNVTLTNSFSGDIELVSLSKRYWEGVKDDDNYDAYTAAGSVTVKADKNGIESKYTVGNISGYKNVTLTGYRDIRIVAGVLTGGNERIEVEDREFEGSAQGTLKMTGADITSAKGFNAVTMSGSTVTGDVAALSEIGTVTSYGGSYKRDSDWEGDTELEELVETAKSAGNFSMTDNTTVGGNVLGYKNVKVTGGSIAGSISLSPVFTRKFKDDDGIKTLSYKESSTGSVTLKDTVVGDVGIYSQIWGYKSVKVTNSNVYANVSNWVVNYSADYRIRGGKVSKDTAKLEEKADGTFSMSIDKNGAADYQVGDIAGFDKVTISGYSAKGEEKAVSVSGGIRGGKRTTSGTTKGDFSVITSPNFEEGTFAILTSSGSVTLSKNVIVEGDIAGYKTVKISRSEVQGDINADPYTYPYKGDFDLDSEDMAFANATFKYSKGESSSYKESAVGSLTIADSIIGVNDDLVIAGFNSVKVTNSNLYGTVRSGLVSYSAEFKNGKDTAKYEQKASGSFTMSIDKNGAADYQVGDIADFEKVTISGYSSKGVEKSVTVKGSVSGGSLVRTGTSEGKFSPADGINFKDEEEVYSSVGSVTLSNNVKVEDMVVGFNKVTVKKSSVMGDITGLGEGKKAAASVALTDAVVGGVISNYKSFSASGEVHVGSFVGTSTNDTFKVAKKATLYIDSIDLGDDVKDKLTIDGTLVTASLKGVESISGKGIVYGSHAVCEALAASTFKGTVNDLGANFAGLSAEQSDNSDDAAVEWDGASPYAGWLSRSGVAVDEVDYIKFTAAADGELQITGDFAVGAVVTLNDEQIVPGGAIALTAGIEYTLKLSVAPEQGAMDYSVAIA